jgi:cell division protease FtsH
MARETIPGSAPPPREAPRPNWKSWVPLAIVLAGTYAWQAYSAHRDAHPAISYTAFYTLVADAKVESIVVRGQSATGHLKAPEKVEGHDVTNFTTMLPASPEPDLFPSLRKQGVTVVVQTEEQPPLVKILMAVLPWVLIVGVWYLLSRSAQKMMQGGGPFGGIMRPKSHRFVQETAVKVKFDDVAGLKAAKQDLREIVDFLREPERFQRLGGKVPRGVLLIGPPGTGKTLLARAVAGESGVPFFSMSGSEFIELFVGMGAARVRELFAEAKKVAPAIIFIDEIDAVGRSRGTGLGGGHDEREQTLNQLLSEMDGFSRNDLTVVLAATNRPDVLDSALLRPGRFDRRVVVDRPECAARLSILEVHTKGKPIGKDVNLKDVAQNTPGFAGADLANLVNEAALNATRRGANEIEGPDFAAAQDKIVLGDARETSLDRGEKRRVAIHECGHATVAYFTPDTEPLWRVSIIPRGMSLGATQQTPGEDKHINSQPELESRLRVLMGGYAAEVLVYGQPSSGSENDLRQAMEIAYRMVAQFGMSERVGPVFYEHRAEHPFLGQRLASDSGISDLTVHAIEEETRKLLANALEGAKTVITTHQVQFDRLVAVVLEHETVERVELEQALGPKVAAAVGFTSGMVANGGKGGRPHAF